MIQLQVLNRLLTDKSLNLITDTGVTNDHFNEYNEEYTFIMSHYAKFGNVPDDETMLNKFPDFELLDVFESPKYLIETLHEEYLYNQAVPIISKSAELLQTNADDAVQYLVPKLQQLLQKCTYCGGTDIMKNTFERFELMLAKREKQGILGISSGLKELDDIVAGWQPGEELVTIVGRVNQGKSWILLYFLAMAWKQGKKVLLYSGEMSQLQVACRADTLLSNISNRAIVRGTLDESGCNEYQQALNDFESKNVPFIVVTPKDLGGKQLNVPMLQSLIEKYEPDIVGIDQFSLMSDARSNRDVLRVQMAHIAQDLFHTSEKYKIPILADAQANRGAMDKDSPDAPELHQIGESDGIGQNSSKVISIVQTPAGLKLKVTKNRNGENNKSLTYCWDIDKGTFVYLGDGPDLQSADTKPELPVRNRKSKQAQEETFDKGTEVF